jgi:uncharacterized protein YceH (UPF0502 family)
MTAPILTIMWSYRRSFLLAMGLTFLVLALVILMLPNRAAIRSSIEIGSTLVAGKSEPFEPTENVAKRIASLYGPAALLAISEKGYSSSTKLKIPNVESIGRFAVLVSNIDPSVEKETKELHQAIIDLIFTELLPRGQALSESTKARVSLAEKNSESLRQQIKVELNEMDILNNLTSDLRRQVEDLRARLATLYRRVGSSQQQSGESAPLEAQIRELNEQISAQTSLIGNLTIKGSDLARDLARTRRQSEMQDQDLAEAKFEQISLRETRIALPPTRTFTQGEQSRRFNFLLIAAAVSVLAGFGAVALTHNIRRHMDTMPWIQSKTGPPRQTDNPTERT